MNKILLNLALIHLNEFCKKNNRDITGTHIVKDGNFKYSLIKDDTNKKLATVLFTKNTPPKFVLFT